MGRAQGGADLPQRAVPVLRDGPARRCRVRALRVRRVLRPRLARRVPDRDEGDERDREALQAPRPGARLLGERRRRGEGRPRSGVRDPLLVPALGDLAAGPVSEAAAHCLRPRRAAGSLRGAALPARRRAPLRRQPCRRHDRGGRQARRALPEPRPAWRGRARRAAPVRPPVRLVHVCRGSRRDPPTRRSPGSSAA